MNLHKKATSRGVVWAAVLGIIIGAGAYFLLLRPVASTTYVASPVSTATSTVSNASNTSSVVIATSSASQIDTTSWKTFTNYELEFSIQYPPDVAVDSSDPTLFKVNFPRESYFSTVYADDVSVSVSVNSTCPLIDRGAQVKPSVNVVIGGVNFTKFETSDIGAGNIYDTVAYDALNNNSCYQIIFLDHHANGAGLYESDPAKIAALTTARDAEFAHVTDIVNAMISSFAFVSTPAGQDEATYTGGGAGVTGATSTISSSSSSTAASNAPGATPIFISTISPATLSVGGKLTVIGSGFLGHDTLVRISNGSVQGVLWGGMPSSDTSISMTIPGKVCTIYTGGSGAACPAYLIISPGIYTVDVSNQNGTTDTLYLKIQ